MNIRIKLLLSALVFLASSPLLSQQPAPAADPLTSAQQRQMAAIKDAMEQRAAPAAVRLTQITRRIYENMLADTPDEQLRTSLAREMHATLIELLDLKGQSIRDAVAVLTPHQKTQLRAAMSQPGAPADLSELMGKLFQPISANPPHAP